MKVNRDVLRRRATIRLLWEPEADNYMTHFNPGETTDWITAELKRGNQWAWFCAHVIVSYKGLTEEDYLGCCSYESEDAFKGDPVYQDMVDQCTDHLVSQLEALVTDHALWDHEAGSCLWCIAETT